MRYNIINIGELNMSNQYQDIYDEVEKILKKEEKNSANIMHILNKSSDENSHSAMICRLLNVPPYRKKFFKIIDLASPSDKEFKIEKFANGRRMDIYLENDDMIVCIENKIFSGDQFEQLKDYWNYINDRKNKKQKPYIIYLTLNKKDPSEDSIDSSEWKKLIKNKKAYCLSYSHIENWLKNCKGLKKDVNENEKLLLDQYLDSIQYLIQDTKNTEELKKQILATFKPKRINSLDDWKKLYTICEPDDNDIKKRLRPVLRNIGKETAERLIQKNTCPKKFYRNAGNGFEYYFSTYNINNIKFSKSSFSLQLIYRYRTDRSPFEPYIGVYNIPKKYRKDLEMLLKPIFVKNQYSLNTSSINYIYANIDYNKDHKALLKDHKALLGELDIAIRDYLVVKNIALNQ